MKKTSLIYLIVGLSSLLLATESFGKSADKSKKHIKQYADLVQYCICDAISDKGMISAGKSCLFLVGRDSKKGTELFREQVICDADCKGLLSTLPQCNQAGQKEKAEPASEAFLEK